MKKDSNTKIKRGTKNVFADLGFPDAESHLLKAGLVSRIQDRIDRWQQSDMDAAPSADFAAHMAVIQHIERCLRSYCCRHHLIEEVYAGL